MQRQPRRLQAAEDGSDYLSTFLHLSGGFNNNLDGG